MPSSSPPCPLRPAVCPRLQRRGLGTLPAPGHRRDHAAHRHRGLSPQPQGVCLSLALGGSAAPCPAIVCPQAALPARAKASSHAQAGGSDGGSSAIGDSCKARAFANHSGIRSHASRHASLPLPCLALRNPHAPSPSRIYTHLPSASCPLTRLPSQPPMPQPSRTHPHALPPKSTRTLRPTRTLILSSTHALIIPRMPADPRTSSIPNPHFQTPPHPPV